MNSFIKSTRKLKPCKHTKSSSGRCQNKRNLQNSSCPFKIGYQTSKPKTLNVNLKPTKRRATMVNLTPRHNNQRQLKVAPRRPKNRSGLRSTSGLTTGSPRAKPGISLTIQPASLGLHVRQSSQLRSTHQLLVRNLTKRLKGKA